MKCTNQDFFFFNRGTQMILAAGADELEREESAAKTHYL